MLMIDSFKIHVFSNIYLPLMITLKLHKATTFSLSTVSHTTVVLPIGNSDPDFGLHVASTGFPLLSVAVGSLYTIMAVGWLVLVDSI